MSSAGAVYIFTRSGSTWTQQAKIQASDKEASDQFGTSAAIDGDTVIVGASGEDTGGSSAGAAYIFTRSGSTWTQQAKIQASDIQAGDQFGKSVAIDGDTIVVSAPNEDTGASNAGSLYVFTGSGSTWTQQAKIQASDKESSDRLGELSRSVAIDGDTIVYIFTRSGSTWTQQAKIQASDIQAGDGFGYNTAIEGDVVVVGALTTPAGAVDDAGAAYIFTRSGSTWTQQKKLQATNPVQSGYFTKVAISGESIIVGSLQTGETAEVFIAG